MRIMNIYIPAVVGGLDIPPYKIYNVYKNIISVAILAQAILAQESFRLKLKYLVL